ncbi:MAG: DNA polymerase II [Granulosicoccus sp.]
MTLDAYLLTRQWRDTPSGVELLFWATSSEGAVRVIVESQQAVCFIERTVSLPLPDNVERRARDLQLLHHGPVDALYFRQQKQLQQLRQSDAPLCESDIKPADRYLMERFICAAFTIEGDLQPRDGYLQVINPRLIPCNYQPTLKTVSIDIETRGRTRQLYSIAAATMDSEQTDNTSAQAYPDNVVFMIGSGESIQRKGYTLCFCLTEKELLGRFFDWIQQADPDVLTGWAVVNFDLNFIDSKCRALGMSFQLGRAREQAAVLQPGNPGSPRIARVPGRAVLDGIDQLKAGFWSFDSFSLDNVSYELLGNGKLITPEQDKVATINRLFAEDKPQLADYNHRDCTLVNDIFTKAQLLPFAIQRANLTGLALDRLGGSVAAFDNLYLPKLHRKGFVAPDVRTQANDAGSPGGYVMDSRPGLYRNVLVLDFKSLYPSIIRTFFIDPLGLAEPGDNPVPGFVDASFSRERHILPQLIESLWAARDEAKKASNAPLSQAIKIIMNSFYGVLGTTGCRFYSQQLASSITRRGHEIILQSRDWIQSQGYEVIYGDTDSVFVWLGEGSQDSDGHVVGTRLMHGLNQWWHDELQRRYQINSHLEVEYETHYLRFFMPTIRGMSTGSKKRYAGLSTSTQAVTTGSSLEDAKLVVKGLEAARTDWTPLARDFQKELFRRIFNDEPYEDFVRQTAQDVSNGQLDEQLIYRKRIRRDLADYQRNVPPHIKAARKLANSGSSIRYLITRNGPEPVDALVSTIDYQHYLDKQLAPAADGILQFMDTSFKSITDAQLQMF